MRRALVPVALLVTLTSCAPAPKGPAQTVALEQVSADSGLDITGARQAVVEFLRAYAGAESDGAAALRAIVVGPKLQRWAYWLNVQNRSFPGTFSATTEIRTLNFLQSIPFQGTLGAEVDLGATVTFSYKPNGAQPFQQMRILDGPVTLLRAGTGDWRVVDVTRDGQSMDNAIELFDKQSVTEGEVTVRLDSLFAFTPRWQFNLVVENRSGRAIALDTKDTALVSSAGGSSKRATAAVSPSLVRIANGATVNGLMGFPPQQSVQGRTLSVHFREAGGKVLLFEFPLPALVKPAPAPTASEAAPVATS